MSGRQDMVARQGGKSRVGRAAGGGGAAGAGVAAPGQGSGPGGGGAGRVRILAKSVAPARGCDLCLKYMGCSGTPYEQGYTWGFWGSRSRRPSAFAHVKAPEHDLCRYLWPLRLTR